MAACITHCEQLLFKFQVNQCAVLIEILKVHEAIEETHPIYYRYLTTPFWIKSGELCLIFKIKFFHVELQ